MYGIPDQVVLKSISDSGDDINASAKREQLYIRRRIAELEQLMCCGSSYFLRQSYERELNSLRQMIDESVLSVAPIAVSQVNYQEKEIKARQSSEASLRNFASRFLR